MEIVQITIWRGARSQGETGMLGVYWAIQNRANSGRGLGPPYPERVCLQAFRFSCWNSSDPPRDLYPKAGDPQYAMAAAFCALPGADPAGGATAYYRTDVSAPPWATPENATIQIGKLRLHRIGSLCTGTSATETHG